MSSLFLPTSEFTIQEIFNDFISLVKKTFHIVRIPLKKFIDKETGKKLPFTTHSLDFHLQAHSHDVIMFKVCTLLSQTHHRNYSIQSLMILLAFDELFNTRRYN